MKKTVISILLIFALILSFSACLNDTNEETTQRQETTTAFQQTLAPIETTTLSSELVEPQEETTTDEAFAFNKADAVSLGKIDSEIYGTLTLYLQDDKIVILDEYKDIKFLLDANGYTTKNVESKVEVESTDLNFDGYSDFMLLYSETEFNTYYFCWIWNMAEREFRYYTPLSSIPSPQVIEDEDSILSLNRTSATQMTVTTYKWIEGNLVAQNHQTVTDEQQTVLSESVDSEITFTQGGYTSEISLLGNVGSSSQWHCRIENEEIISLVASGFTEENAQYTFSITGMTPGTTTMIFRYALSWEADYVSEKILNVTVNDDYTISIVEIE